MRVAKRSRLSLLQPVIALVVAVFISAACVQAQSGVYAYFNDDPVTLLGSLQSDFGTYVMSNPSVAGITVVISWKKYDAGGVTTGPILNITTSSPDLQQLDTDMATIAGSKKINLIVWAGTASGSGGMNFSTPTYIFDPSWPAFCSSLPGLGCNSTDPPVDTCDCHNYHGGNWHTSADSFCANKSAGATFDIGGVPAGWEEPFYLAYEFWLKKLLAYYNSKSGASAIKGQIGYIRIGVGTGGGSVVACPSVEKGIFMGGNAAPVPPLDEVVWKNYNNSVYAAVAKTKPTMVLEASPFGGLALGMSDGSTPLSWADDVAQVAVANGLGIGAESLNGTSDQGDPLLYWQIQPCSNDWCSLFNSYYSLSPMRSLQTLSPTNPNCLNSPTSCNLTGSLVTVLPFATQNHATTFEIYYNDLLCAYDMNSYMDSTYCPQISPGVYLAPYMPYQWALADAAAQQPKSTAAIAGKASLSGSSAIH